MIPVCARELRAKFDGRLWNGNPLFLQRGSSSSSFAVCENNCRRLWSSLARTFELLFLAFAFPSSPAPRDVVFSSDGVCIELCQLYDSVARTCVIREGKYARRKGGIRKPTRFLTLRLRAISPMRLDERRDSEVGMYTVNLGTLI